MESLPPEVHVYICKFLSPRSLVALSQTASSFLALCRAAPVHQDLILRLTGLTVPKDADQDGLWKEGLWVAAQAKYLACFVSSTPYRSRLIRITASIEPATCAVVFTGSQLVPTNYLLSPASTVDGVSSVVLPPGARQTGPASYFMRGDMDHPDAGLQTDLLEVRVEERRLFSLTRKEGARVIPPGGEGEAFPGMSMAVRLRDVERCIRQLVNPTDEDNELQRERERRAMRGIALGFHDEAPNGFPTASLVPTASLRAPLRSLGDCLGTLAASLVEIHFPAPPSEAPVNIRGFSLDIKRRRVLPARQWGSSADVQRAGSSRARANPGRATARASTSAGRAPSPDEPVTRESAGLGDVEPSIADSILRFRGFSTPSDPQRPADGGPAIQYGGDPSRVQMPELGAGVRVMVLGPAGDLSWTSTVHQQDHRELDNVIGQDSTDETSAPEDDEWSDTPGSGKDERQSEIFYPVVSPQAPLDERELQRLRVLNGEEGNDGSVDVRQLEGIWAGSYGGHGVELGYLAFCTSYTGAGGPSPALVYTKLTGDVNVPAGEISWSCVLPEGDREFPRLETITREDYDLPAGARDTDASAGLGVMPSRGAYHGRGRVALSGFVRPSWTPATVVLLRDTVRAGQEEIDCVEEIRVRWKALGHVSSFRRVRV